MIQEFTKFAGFKVLKWFIQNPSNAIHIKELARILKISPSTSKNYCDLLEKDNILILNKIGNLNLFILNNNSIYVKELKKTISLMIFKELKLEKISEKAISIAIYGSFASGEYNLESDLDILIIGKDLDINKDYVIKIEKKIKRQIQLTIIRYPKWEKMKNNNDIFTKEILKNHILLKGSKL